ncbi:hypothetical protein RI054_29g119520 [Pseudoscourfieldia marina]
MSAPLPSGSSSSLYLYRLVPAFGKTLGSAPQSSRSLCDALNNAAANAHVSVLKAALAQHIPALMCQLSLHSLDAQAKNALAQATLACTPNPPTTSEGRQMRRAACVLAARLPDTNSAQLSMVAEVCLRLSMSAQETLAARATFLRAAAASVVEQLRSSRAGVPPQCAADLSRAVASLLASAVAFATVASSKKAGLFASENKLREAAAAAATSAAAVARAAMAVVLAARLWAVPVILAQALATVNALGDADAAMGGDMRRHTALAWACSLWGSTKQKDAAAAAFASQGRHDTVWLAYIRGVVSPDMRMRSTANDGATMRVDAANLAGFAAKVAAVGSPSREVVAALEDVIRIVKASMAMSGRSVLMCTVLAAARNMLAVVCAASKATITADWGLDVHLLDRLEDEMLGVAASLDDGAHNAAVRGEMAATWIWIAQTRACIDPRRRIWYRNNVRFHILAHIRMDSAQYHAAVLREHALASDLTVGYLSRKSVVNCALNIAEMAAFLTSAVTTSGRSTDCIVRLFHRSLLSPLAQEQKRYNYVTSVFFALTALRAFQRTGNENSFANMAALATASNAMTCVLAPNDEEVDPNLERRVVKTLVKLIEDIVWISPRKIESDYAMSSLVSILAAAEANGRDDDFAKETMHSLREALDSLTNMLDATEPCSLTIFSGMIERVRRGARAPPSMFLTSATDPRKMPTLESNDYDISQSAAMRDAAAAGAGSMQTGTLVMSPTMEESHDSDNESVDTSESVRQHSPGASSTATSTSFPQPTPASAAASTNLTRPPPPSPSPLPPEAQPQPPLEVPPAPPASEFPPPPPADISPPSNASAASNAEDFAFSTNSISSMQGSSSNATAPVPSGTSVTIANPVTAAAAASAVSADSTPTDFDASKPMIVRFRFVSETEGELSVAEGERVFADYEADGWLFCRRRDGVGEGFVPEAYLSPLPIAAADSSKVSSLRCLYDFTAQEEGEMSVSRGSIVHLVEETEGWLLVQLPNGGVEAQGWVPSSFLARV